MANLTNYLENKLLDHVLRNVTYTPAATVYFGLYTTTPTDAGGGVEVSGAGYGRLAITFGTPVDGEVKNTNQLAFTASGGNFGTIVAVGIFDAVSAGNLLWYNEILPVTVADTDTVTFPAGHVTATLD